MKAKYRTLCDINTRCARKPLYVYPVDVVIEMDPEHPGTKKWLDKKRIEQVSDETELTPTIIIKTGLAKLMKRKGKRKRR